MPPCTVAINDFQRRGAMPITLGIAKYPSEARLAYAFWVFRSDHFALPVANEKSRSMTPKLEIRLKKPWPIAVKKFDNAPNRRYIGHSVSFFTDYQFLLPRLTSLSQKVFCDVQ